MAIYSRNSTSIFHAVSPMCQTAVPEAANQRDCFLPDYHACYPEPHQRPQEWPLAIFHNFPMQVLGPPDRHQDKPQRRSIHLNCHAFVGGRVHVKCQWRDGLIVTEVGVRIKLQIYAA